MLEPIPSIANGGRNANGTLATATRPITAPTKKIKHIEIDETVEVQKKKTWPHKGNTFVITLIIGLAIGIAISYSFLWLPFGGPREDVGHTGSLIGWSAVIIFVTIGILWFFLSLAQRATDEYKD